MDTKPTIIHNAKLYLGDCLHRLKELPDNSIDSIVTDPPYGLSFMGKKWDYDVPSQDVWAECLRVLKPGGHLLAFAGTRTQHRMAVRIEDAGFEIRDMIAWVYGSGFPKSLDVSKAIDKAAGVEFDAVPASGVGFMNADGAGGYNVTKNQLVRKGESTEAAQQWQGWGTALKPALEPITVARKPLIGTVAENVLAHGTGAINVDGCRVGDTVETWPASRSFRAGISSGYTEGIDKGATQSTGQAPAGRWPANLIHDGSDQVVGLFPADKQGSAARFFYAPKASKRDRDEGLDGFEARPAANAYGDGLNTATKIRTAEQAEAGVDRELRRNTHPTVKPTDLMRYLCRLVTPPNGVVLDPFMGSGSTGKAAMLEGFQFIGIERDEKYFPIAEARIKSSTPKNQFHGTSKEDFDPQMNLL